LGKLCAVSGKTFPGSSGYLVGTVFANGGIV
jgi:hypothetical protein